MPVNSINFQTPAQGAMTPLYLCVSPEVSQIWEFIFFGNLPKNFPILFFIWNLFPDVNGRKHKRAILPIQENLAFTKLGSIQ